MGNAPRRPPGTSPRTTWRLVVWFHPAGWPTGASLFVDVFPLRAGERYLSRSDRSRRVSFRLGGPVSREQIMCLEQGHGTGGMIDRYACRPFFLQKQQQQQMRRRRRRSATSHAAG